jgi:hypothetical protein
MTTTTHQIAHYTVSTCVFQQKNVQIDWPITTIIIIRVIKMFSKGSFLKIIIMIGLEMCLPTYLPTLRTSILRVLLQIPPQTIQTQIITLIHFQLPLRMHPTMSCGKRTTSLE